jgi:predicted MFS family arabinose efflux permease
VNKTHLVALGVGLIAISYGFGRYTYGLFVPEIREVLGIGPAAIGAVAGAGHLGYILSVLLCMRLIRAYSPRGLMLLGGGCAAGGLGLVGLAGSPFVLALGLFLASMSAGWIWTATPDAVRQLLPPEEEAGVLAWANAGTGVGVLLAAPIALLLLSWREAYLAYTGLSLAVTLWAGLVLPHLKPDADAPVIQLRLKWFVGPRSGPLLGNALLAGVVAAIYWTFAVDLIVVAGRDAPWVGRLVWFASGAAGVLGIPVAALIRRYGVRRVVPANAVLMALAMGLLAAFPTYLAAILLSAVLFGAGFIVITGLLAIWSVDVFEDRPSAGIGAALVLIAVGQVIGPVIAGLIAEVTGLIPVFYGAALVSLASMGFRPHRDEDLQVD